MKQLTLSQTIEGFLLEKQAQHLSPHTVADYTNAFRSLPQPQLHLPPFHLQPERQLLRLRAATA